MAEDEAPWRSNQPLAPGLYLVGTPIGNLEDITLRALRVLASVDRIACEDTRETGKLLHHFSIDKPLVSLHAHNEGERAPGLVEDLKAGATLAVVSDAGMPGISDPGMHLVARAIEAGVPVYPIPGANAALAALVASGLGTERWSFRGFLPEKSGARRTELEKLRTLAGGETLILYEAPHRILETLADLRAIWGAGARVAIGRELTKLHEEFLRGTVAEVEAELTGRERVRGEMVLLLDASSPETQTAGAAASIRDAVRALVDGGVEEREALKRVARERGLGKSEVYREWQRAR